MPDAHLWRVCRDFGIEGSDLQAMALLMVKAGRDCESDEFYGQPVAIDRRSRPSRDLPALSVSRLNVRFVLAVSWCTLYCHHVGIKTPLNLVNECATREHFHNNRHLRGRLSLSFLTSDLHIVAFPSMEIEQPHKPLNLWIRSDRNCLYPAHERLWISMPL